MKNLSKKEMESLKYIVANHYPIEKLDDKNSYASKVYSMENLGKKEINSLLYIVANHYDIEQFDNENSYASKLYSKLLNIK